MNKKMLTLIAFLVAITSIFAVFVEIGDGETTTNYVPFYGLYDYSWSTYILTSEQIGDAIDINQLQFNVGNTPANYQMENQQVYMKLTTDTEVTVTYPDPTNNGFTLVFDGSVNWNQSGWQGVNLDTEFAYDGTSNLQIVWENHNGDYASGYPNFLKTDTTTNTCAYKYADTNFPAIDGTVQTYFPNTRLGYAVEGAPGFPEIVSPENNSLNNELDTDLVWTYGENTEYIHVYLSENEADVINNVESALVVDGDLVTSFSPTLENATVYYWKVVASNSTSEIEESTGVYSFSTIYGIAESPYFEGFEDVTPPALPLGWMTYNETTNSYTTVETTTSQAYEGSNAFKIYNSGDTAGSLIAVLPQIENMASRMKFYAKCSSAGSQLIVGYFTDVNDYATFTEIQTVDLTSDYQEHIVELELPRTVRYLGFKHGNTSTYQTIYFDNVLVEEIPENEPTPATLLTPIDGAIEVALDAELTWEYGMNTASVNLYLSDDIVEVTDLAEDAMVIDGQDVTSYTADLEEWTTYYWRIGSLNTTGYEVLSDISSFTTVMPEEGTIQIGDGTETNQGMPMEPYYGYTYTQSIYSQADIDIAGDIEIIAWHYNGYSAWGPDDIKIYMAHTSLTSYETTDSWVALDDLTLVYDGTLSVPAVDGWVPVTLDTPFSYNNTDNLIIAFEENTTGYHGNNEEFYNTAADENVSITYRNDSTNPDPATPPTGTLKAYYPNVVLVTDAGNPPVEDYLPPTNFTAVVVDENDVQISWDAPEIDDDASRDLTGYTVYRDDVILAELETGVTSYLDEDLDPGTYDYKAVANYGTGDSDPTPIVTIVIEEEDILPPLNLTATVSGQDVTLNWLAPETETPDDFLAVSKIQNNKKTREERDLTGYKIYRDESEIATVASDILTYTDEELDFANYDYYVTAVYTAGESEPSNTVTVSIVDSSTFLPPTNLTGTAIGSDVELNWEAPLDLSEGVWISKGADDNDDGIGTDAAAVISVAHMYTQDELAMYQGLFLNSIKFFPREASATYTIKVWGGAAGNTELYSEVATNVVNEAWNEHAMTSSVAIPATGPLYIGYVADTPAGFPAGCDAGPAVTGGDMIKLGDQATWDVLSEITTISVNWNIKAFVSGDGTTKAIGNTVVKTNKPVPTNKAENAQIIAGNLNPIVSARFNVERDVTAYKIYRDNEEIAEVASDVFTYTDADLANGSYEYHVTAMYGTSESINSNSVTVVVNVSEPGDYLIEDSFETYTDFALDAGPWTLIDGDLSTTYAFNGTEFENNYAPMAYVVFNPSMTTPPLEGTDYEAVDGLKYMASFAATTPGNNDWLISQEFTLADSGTFSFWAKSLTSEYGLERFNVLVSDGSTNPNDFTSISGATYTEAPLTWTQFSYDLEDYEYQTIRVAIQCVSNDAFLFMVDKVQLDAPGGTDIEDNNIAAVSQLIGNYPNPFNPETRIAFSTKENGPVSIDIYNIKGQKVRSLLNENREAGSHTVVWNGKDDNGKSVASGVFFYRMKSGKYSSTKKMILMK